MKSHITTATLRQVSHTFVATAALRQGEFYRAEDARRPFTEYRYQEALSGLVAAQIDLVEFAEVMALLGLNPVTGEASVAAAA